jgi:immunity protein Imm1 of predicted polymorphic toxin system
MNEFRIFLEMSTDYPMLIIQVNADVAWLYYLPSQEHAGFNSVGHLPGLDPTGRTKFVSLGPQDEQRPNTQVVSFTTALGAAKEFFLTGRLPECVNWFDIDSFRPSRS